MDEFTCPLKSLDWSFSKPSICLYSLKYTSIGNRLMYFLMIEMNTVRDVYKGILPKRAFFLFPTATGDARIVKSASSPVSGERLDESRKHQNSAEDKLAKRNPKNFSRDSERV